MQYSKCIYKIVTRINCLAVLTNEGTTDLYLSNVLTCP